ncbi:alpha/beta fold hydrolase [Aspergillus lucknowensis]|uniref:Alpha/beta-hydrolase n=1 Tax=Aspergillus lucknowensis TaxID=176173 RepID=A0ABR4LDT5_9EURO
MSSITLDRVFTHADATHETSICWTTLGLETGPSLIFFHGTPWSSFCWTAYAQSLASRFRIYLFDLPGYGKSPGRTPSTGHGTEPDVTFAGLAAAFAHLYHSWGFSSTKPPHVVAHDIGGIVSLRAHLLHGCAYASLCLVDVVALRPFGSAFYQLVGRNSAVFNAVPAAIYEGMLDAYIKGAAYKPLPTKIAEALAAPWLAGGNQGQAGFVRQITQADERYVTEVEERYAEVGAVMPVKVIWGKEDTWIPVEQAVRLGKALQAREVAIIDGAGHLIMFDQPEQLATELTLWLIQEAVDNV